MKKRKILALVMVVSLLGALMTVGCAAEPEPAPAPAPAPEMPTIHMKIAQAMMTKDTLTHQAVEEMARTINSQTDGKITFDVFGPEIGDWTELDVMVRMGTVDLGFNSHDPGYDPRWNATSLPFAATSFDAAAVVTGPGAIFEQMGKEWAPAINQYYLATFLNNLGMIGLNHDPVITPEEAAGVKIRCWPGETPKCYVAKMGFTPVTIPWAEAPTAVGTGIVDGWVGSGSVYHWTLFRDVARTQLKTFDFLEMWDISINLDTWNSMPQEYQDLFQTEAHRLSVQRLGQLEDEEAEYEQMLKDYGWEIVYMAQDYPDELAVWAELARECWVDLEPLIGKHWVDQVRMSLGMPVE